MAQLPDKKYFQQIRQTVGRSINRHQLIEANDNILIGLSGGKDSLALVEILALRRKYLPIDYQLTAVHVDIRGMQYQADLEFLSEFCHKLDVAFEHRTVEAKLKTDSRKTPCFFCAWTRRKTLFTLTRELQCNKLALGHHMDDANETLMLNMIYHGSLSSLPIKLQMFDGRIELIRPLLHLTDEQLKEYAHRRCFPTMPKDCPYQEDSQRNNIKQLLQNMYQQNRSARINIFNAASNVFSEYLPVPKER